MGTRGPIPTPTAIKHARGSWRARLESRTAPMPKLGRPRCPSWLDANAKAIWKSVVPELERLGVLASVDQMALTVLCSTWSSYRNAVEAARKQPAIIETLAADGSIKHRRPNPYLKLARDTAADLNKWLREFGLTPASRTRLEIQIDNGNAGSAIDDRYRL